MNRLALVSVVLGVLIILLRGPMIFAPEVVIERFKKLIITDARLRILGVILTLFGVVLIVSAWGVDHGAAYAVLVMGCLLAFAAFLLQVIFPSLYRQIADIVFTFNLLFFRVVGVIGVALGLLFLYFGFFVFPQM